MLDTRPFTDEQWFKMCDLDMSMPVPLANADLTKPFVYDRAFGVFSAPSNHQFIMSLLLAWQHSCPSGLLVGAKLGLSFPWETADTWLLNTPGAAFLSSVSSQISVATGKGLTPEERRLFRDYCLF